MLQFKRSNLLVALVWGLVSFGIQQNAMAGNEGAHGGNVVICPGQPTVVLDYYEAALGTIGSGSSSIVDISNMSANDVIALGLSRVEKFIELSEQAYGLLDTTGNMSTWISASLSQVNDSNEPYLLPPGCSLRTAVLRQDDGTMFGDPSILNMLSPAQKGILSLHEIFYRLSSDQSSSVNVRALIRQVLQKAPDFDELRSAVGALNQNLGDIAVCGISCLNGVKLEAYPGLPTVDMADEKACHTQPYYQITNVDIANHSFHMDLNDPDNCYSGLSPQDTDLILPGLYSVDVTCMFDYGSCTVNGVSEATVELKPKEQDAIIGPSALELTIHDKRHWNWQSGTSFLDDSGS